MKSSIKYLHLIICFLINIGIVSSKEFHVQKANVKFIIDSTILEKGKVELELSLYSYYYIKATELYDQREVQLITDTVTKFEFDINYDISILTVQLFINKEPYLFFLNQSAYLIESGDTLIWKIDDKITLLGKDHNKNKVRKNISMMNRNVSTSWLSYYIDKSDMNTYFYLTNEYYDALAYQKIQYLNKLKLNNPISEKAYKYIKEECIYDTESKRVNRLLNSIFKGAIYQKEILPYAINELEKIRCKNLSSSGVTHSFIQYLMDIVTAEFFIEEYTKNPERKGLIPELDVVFKKIKNVSEGNIRIQLIAFLFTRFESSGVNGDLIIDEAIDLATDKKMKSYLLEIKNKRYVKSPIYSFHFEDQKGEVFTPESFKGKKVIFDFWFNGCLGCAVLHKHLIDFEDDINDPNILFVTVNVDKNREKWIQGLKSNKYTSSDGLNLRVMDNARNILKYYEFHGYPQLLVMDESGNLISFETPKPIDEESKKRLKKILYN